VEENCLLRINLKEKNEQKKFSMGQKISIFQIRTL